MVIFQEHQILPAFILNLKKEKLSYLMKCFKFSLFPTKTNPTSPSSSSTSTSLSTSSPLSLSSVSHPSHSLPFFSPDEISSDVHELEFVLSDEMNNRRRMRKELINNVVTKNNFIDENENESKFDC